MKKNMEDTILSRPSMENSMEKKMGHDMKTGSISGAFGFCM